MFGSTVVRMNMGFGVKTADTLQSSGLKAQKSPAPPAPVFLQFRPTSTASSLLVTGKNGTIVTVQMEVADDCHRAPLGQK